MNKVLVVYFSATGTTESVAKRLADVLNADIFEIVPSVKYTKEDLDWTNKQARSTVEMKDLTSRPSIKNRIDNMDEYDTIFIGFPMWWYIAPTIINTFLESYDLTNKTIIPFATSLGSGMGKTNENLLVSCKGAKLLEGKVLVSNGKEIDLNEWIKMYE